LIAKKLVTVGIALCNHEKYKKVSKKYSFFATFKALKNKHDKIKLEFEDFIYTIDKQLLKVES